MVCRLACLWHSFTQNCYRAEGKQLLELDQQKRTGRVVRVSLFGIRKNATHLNQPGIAMTISNMEAERETSSRMSTRGHGKHKPKSLADSLISELSTISTQCRFLREDLPKDVPEYPDCLERLLAIQDTATAMLDEIMANRDRLDSMKKAG